MASDYNVVCNLSESSDQKITFCWDTQTGVGFDPYHLTGTSLAAFNKAVSDTRVCLGEVVHHLHGRRIQEALRSCHQLARAGNRLYKAIFDACDNAGKTEAKAARKWLEGYRDKDVATLEVIVNSLRPIPWTAVYDEPPPDENQFLASLPVLVGRGMSDGEVASHWKPFWGLRYNLASRRRTRPAGVAPLLNPRVLLVMDYKTYSDLSASGDPAAEPSRLIDVARVQNATVCLVLKRDVFDKLPTDKAARLLEVLGKKDWEALLQAAPDASQRALLEESLARIIRIIHSDQLEEVLGETKPSVMYVICHAGPASLILGDNPFDTTRLYGLCQDYIGDGLAFLNACATAVKPTTAGSFFDSVYDARMRGLVATEERTVDLFAHHFGLDFLQEFLQTEVGVARLLRKLRRNRVPLGLLYSAYCPANLSVSKQPAVLAECQ